MLKQIANKTGLLNRLRARWRQDVDELTKPLRNDVRRLRRDVEELQATLADVSERAARGDRTAAQWKTSMLLDSHHRDRLASLDDVLNPERIGAHIDASVAAAPLYGDPYDHCVVERLLPDDVYQLLIEALPPLPFFDDRDPVKRDLPLPIELGPQLSIRVWNFMDEMLARQVLLRAVMKKFHEPLQRHYAEVFGETHRELANNLPQSTSRGRLMLRRPGYHLAPHRDPKRSLITCLMYLARPGDSETYGTQIFRVIGDHEASYKQTYFPEEEGRRCEVVKTVPFRANSMLIFLNSRGAHGATIPADAPPELERYTYQFYVTPKAEALTAFVKTLTPERRARWVNKSQVAAP